MLGVAVVVGWVFAGAAVSAMRVIWVCCGAGAGWCCDTAVQIHVQRWIHHHLRFFELFRINFWCLFVGEYLKINEDFSVLFINIKKEFREVLCWFQLDDLLLNAELHLPFSSPKC